MKSLSMAVTIEGDVEVKKGEKGSDFATGVGVGMDGVLVALSFFWRRD